MRTDLYKNIANPDEGFDEDYIQLLLALGNEYLKYKVSPLKCYDKMDSRLEEVYDLIQKGKLSKTDFKYVLQSFSNGFTFHPRKVHQSFDCFNEYVTFDRDRAAYVSIKDVELVNYLADNIERKEFEEWRVEWLQNVFEESSKEAEETKQMEEDLLKEIENDGT